MFSKLATLSTIFVYAISVVANCSSPDNTPPVCQTSNGSPVIGDCQAAISQLSGQCQVTNGAGSDCSTLVTVGTCKIDACGDDNAELLPGVNCGGYLQNILNTCGSNNLVGGLLSPASCNVENSPNNNYRLQFSRA